MSEVWDAAASTFDAVVRDAGREPELRLLSDPVLWGGPMTDQRYLVVA